MTPALPWTALPGLGHPSGKKFSLMPILNLFWCNLRPLIPGAAPDFPFPLSCQGVVQSHRVCPEPLFCSGAPSQPLPGGFPVPGSAPGARGVPGARGPGRAEPAEQLWEPAARILPRTAQPQALTFCTARAPSRSLIASAACQHHSCNFPCWVPLRLISFSVFHKF